MDIREFIERYKNGTVQITSDVKYDLKTEIETNRRLFHSKYKSSKDSAGLNKFFYNVGMILLNSLYNATDIDTKDVSLRSTHWKYNKLVDLVKTRVKTHLRLTRFGTFINKVRANMLKDGTCVVKMVGDHPEVVDLLNYIDQPSNPGIGACAERFYWDYETVLSKTTDKSKKETIKELYEKMQKDSVSTFTVYEYWNEFDFDGEKHIGCKVYVDSTAYDEQQGQTKDDWEPYIQIDEFKTPFKKKKDGKMIELYPYKKCHFIEVEGRSIGFGVFELIRGIIEHFNELWNIKRKKDRQDLAGTYIHKKGMTGSSLTQEFLDNREVGPVISINQDEDIQKLPVDKFTADILASADKLFEYARMIVGANAVGVGETLPSSMPATTAGIMATQQKTTYDVIVEQMALFLSDFFEDFYLDVIIDKTDKEEWAMCIGDPQELEELDRFFAEQAVYRQLEQMKQSPQLMMMLQDPFAEEQFIQEQVSLVLEQLKQQGDSRFVQLKKKLLSQLDYIVEININNETFDRNSQIQNILAVAGNPLYLGSREKLFNTVLDLLDLGGQKYDKSPEEIQKEQQQLMLQNGSNQIQQETAPAGVGPVGAGAVA
jgi:hypothetical protein